MKEGMNEIYKVGSLYNVLARMCAQKIERLTPKSGNLMSHEQPNVSKC